MSCFLCNIFSPLLPEFKNTPTNGILFRFKAAKTTNNLLDLIFSRYLNSAHFIYLSKSNKQTQHLHHYYSKKDEKD